MVRIDTYSNKCLLDIGKDHAKSQKTRYGVYLTTIQSCEYGKILNITYMASKKQGKVKAIPVKEINEGMQVLYNGKLDIVKLVLRTGYWLENDSSKRVDLKDKDQLKTLVVEYDTPDWNPSLNPLTQLPLKYSQWQSAIDNGEVDSGKIVEFEICRRELNEKNLITTLAKIIPQKKDWEEARPIIKKSLGTYTNDMIRNMATNVIEALNQHYPR